MSLNSIPSQESEILSATVPDELAGQRLDQVLSQLFSDYSRSRLQQWIRDEKVWVDGKSCRAKDKLRGGEALRVEAYLPSEERWEPQAIDLDVVYEDEDILVINKPAGLVAHPAAGNPDGTLLNALLHYEPKLTEVPRAGIVHRLDKETSGLLVVARHIKSQKSLVEQLQSRSLSREYLCVVNGVMTAGGTVDAPIGRHPVDRKRQAVVEGGKEAITHYRVADRYRAHTLVKVKLETGRTHQIRVHMSHINYPLVGDPVYGGRLRLPPACSPVLAETLRGFRRQALHAARLGLIHPMRDEYMEWEAPLPQDMQRLIQALELDREQGRDEER